MAITLTGYSDSDKVPGYYSERIFGAGPINIRTISLIMLVCGLKSSAGSITTNVDVVDIASVTEANAYFGQGSEGARMCAAAIREAQGYRLMGCAPTDAGGDPATATVTFTTSASSNGTWRYYIAGTKIEVSVTSGDTVTTQAAALVTAVGKLPDLPVTATNLSGVVTLTVKHDGIRGNQWIIYQDISSKPGGTTSALAGGSAVTSSGNVSGIFFSAGTGTETLTTMLGVLFPGRYDRIAIAQNDSTSLAAWATHIDAKAGPLEGRSEHVVVATNGTSSAAISLAQSTLNNVRFQLATCFECETHPSEIAAAICAERAAAEQTSPNSSYDGRVLTTVQPQRFPGQIPARATQQTQLDSGVTPIVTKNGRVQIVRAITTHCLNGSTPDYRTIDVGMSAYPDFFADLLGIRWTSQFVIANPYVQDNPGANDPPAAAGVATPDLWNAEVIGILRDEEKRGQITQVSDNLPQSEFNSTAGRIMTRCPVIPTPIQHAIGVRVEQLNAA